MGREDRCGRMEAFMKEIGRKIRPAVMANSFMQMEMYKRENGKKIRQMDMVYIFTIMGLSMKANGRMTVSMAWERRVGLMAHIMRVNILKEESI